MSILVNGGAGFIGGYLDRLLLQRGEKVIVLDTTLDPSPMKLVLAPAEIEQLTLIQADVADAVALFRVVQEHRVRRIVHLVTYDFLKGELVPLEALRSNVQGLLTCFEAARMFGVERVVWAGSVQVFGQHTPYSKEFGGPLLDGGPHRPWTVYAACKSIMEYMGDHYHRKFGVDTRGLRPCGTFGPGRQPGLTAHISDMLKAAALGRPYTMPLGDYRLPHVMNINNLARYR